LTVTDWHTRDVDTVLAELEASEQGLTQPQARQRLLRYGANRLPYSYKPSLVKRFFLQFHNILIYILLVAATVTLFFGKWLDSVVILSVVIINAIIGVVQEGKAQEALKAIQQQLALHVTVLREGKQLTLPVEQLVPGDIVLLAAGTKVPADLRLLEARELRIQEAALTGESLPVTKETQTLAQETPLMERSNMAFAGTMVTYGRGRGVVVATGVNSEVGKISALIKRIKPLQTPLILQMNRFAYYLTLFIIAITGLLILAAWWLHQTPLLTLFMAAVSIAVAAIPEGLPAIITIVFAVGVVRMARRHAIIRRLPAVETMGSVTVICSDKTGTMTRNELVVTDIIAGDERFTVTGTGYAGEGQILSAKQAVDSRRHTALAQLIRIGVLCNEAQLQREDEQWQLVGDPIDGALLALGLKADQGRAALLKEYPLLDTLPFHAEYQLMATLHRMPDGQNMLLVKGAPEKIMQLCSKRQAGDDFQPLSASECSAQCDDIASQGKRTLAFAYRIVPSSTDELSLQTLEQGLIFVGLVGIEDPPRTEVKQAIANCFSAGIQIKMITGDHAATAQSIAARLGLEHPDRVLTGQDIDRMSDARLAGEVVTVNVYARTTPEQKIRLVKALQANHETVAMTGDGVNDAPALKQAEIGIAMGQKGTDAAKESAMMVLTDDNFTTIAAAIEEGRNIYANLKKAILYILPNNGGEFIIIFLAVLLGYTLPITPVQILWVNMVTTVTMDLTLAFEPAEKGLMQAPPRKRFEAILTPLLVWRILFVTLLFAAAGFGLFIHESHLGADLATARTVVINTLVTGQIFYLINCRKIYQATWNKTGWLENRKALIGIAIVIVLQLVFTYSAIFQYFFDTQPLSLAQWGRIVCVGLAIYLAVELEKLVIRRLHSGVLRTVR
jgi:calcium-translocating P-type ATPase